MLIGQHSKPEQISKLGLRDVGAQCPALAQLSHRT